VSKPHALHSIRDNGSHSAACALPFDNVLLRKHPHDMSNRAPQSVFHLAFHRGEVFIAYDTAFRSRMQSCDLAVVGARAKQHGFDERQWEELTLTHETWFRQVV